MVGAPPLAQLLVDADLGTTLPTPASGHRHWLVDLLLSGTARLSCATQPADQWQGGPCGWILPPAWRPVWHPEEATDPPRFARLRLRALPHEWPQPTRRVPIGWRLSADQAALLTDCLLRLLPVLERSEPETAVRLRHLGLEIAIQALDAPRVMTARWQSALAHCRAAIEWQQRQQATEPTIEAIATAIGISASHLRRCFRLVHACSPHQYFDR